MVSALNKLRQNNLELNVEAQIDTSAAFGAYAIGFNLIGA